MKLPGKVLIIINDPKSSNGWIHRAPWWLFKGTTQRTEVKHHEMEKFTFLTSVFDQCEHRIHSNDQQRV